MSKWKALMTPKGGVLFIVGIIVVFGIKYYFNANDELSYEPVSPAEQPDGTIHYTLYHLNQNQKPSKYEPWVLAIPKDIYISRPEELNDLADEIGSIQVNGVSINAGFRPNQLLSFFYKVPEFEVYKDPLGNKPSTSSLERQGNIIKVNIRGGLRSIKLPNFESFGCVISYELFPGIYKLRNARSGEISEDTGSYTYAGKRGCFGGLADEYYAFNTSESGYLGYFRCNKQITCRFNLRDGKFSFQFNFSHEQIKYLPKLYDKSTEFVEKIILKLPSSMETIQ